MPFVDFMTLLDHLVIFVPVGAVPVLTIGCLVLLMSTSWMANIAQPVPNWSDR